ncbi:hypothetical protein BHM03_00048661 [Ensete ventricosum]|nr:hypothetical protein BHM03_00048661 [Ensete ventricosum]
MWSNLDVDSTVTTRRLVETRNNYFIPLEYELHAPMPGERPYDVFPSGFNLSIDALEVGIRGVKDMNEAWLAELGLSPAPRDLFFPFVIYAECFLIVHYHAEMFNLGKMKSGDGAGSGSTVPSAVSKPAIVDVGASTTEKHPSTGEGAGLRKRLRKPVPEQPAVALGSTTSTPAEKGKGVVELKEVPEQGYTTRELCEVEDRVGEDKYFASIMMRLKSVDSEDPLVPRWSAISRSSQVWTEGPLAREYLRGGGSTPHPCQATSAKEWEDKAKKLWTELESLRNQQRELEQEVGVLRSSLDGARNDRARLEGDVLSLTEAAAFLEAELKAEGSKAVTAYKASRGFELGLEKMGRVSYEFEYRVALERLRGKHPEIVIKQDLFVECPDNANVEMDLNQSFDDNAPSEK